jgi:hypothetical protein
VALAIFSTAAIPVLASCIMAGVAVVAFSLASTLFLSIFLYEQSSGVFEIGEPDEDSELDMVEAEYKPTDDFLNNFYKEMDAIILELENPIDKDPTILKLEVTKAEDKPTENLSNNSCNEMDVRILELGNSIKELDEMASPEDMAPFGPKSQIDTLLDDLCAEEDPTILKLKKSIRLEKVEQLIKLPIELQLELLSKEIEKSLLETDKLLGQIEHSLEGMSRSQSHESLQIRKRDNSLNKLLD